MKISEMNGQIYGECKKCGSLELYDLMLLTNELCRECDFEFEEGGNK